MKGPIDYILRKVRAYDYGRRDRHLVGLGYGHMSPEPLPEGMYGDATYNDLLLFAEAIQGHIRHISDVDDSMTGHLRTVQSQVADLSKEVAYLRSDDYLRDVVGRINAMQVNP